jgi:hypothetical protein
MVIRKTTVRYFFMALRFDNPKFGKVFFTANIVILIKFVDSSSVKPCRLFLLRALTIQTSLIALDL